MNDAHADTDPTAAQPPAPDDSRTSLAAQFRGLPRSILIVSALMALALLAFDIWIGKQRRRYEDETDRLRASMTDIERQRADEIVSRERNKLRIAVALIRRQAQVERALHLSVVLDSGAMFLERDGAMLREMPVRIGPERQVGQAPDTVRLAAPRGVRTIARVLTEADVWEVPEWVYFDRGLELPEDRLLTGALGPAILLDGGTVIYSTPSGGPLADSTYVLPGGVRARAEDLRAILPNLTPGTRVYFY